MTDGTAEARYRAPALSKGLDILELLAASEDGLGQADIARTLGRTTSEIFRILVVLRERGYVELDERDRYGLATRLFEIAHRQPAIRRLTAIAGSEMQRLADLVRQSIHLCILSSGKLLVVAQVDCSDTNVNTVRLGAQIPIDDSASGRVLAAFLDDAARADLLEAAGGAGTAARARFLADLDAVRGAGFCHGDSLTIRGVTNISAPVFDYTGRAVAAMTMPFIHRLSGGETVSDERARELLVATCAGLSRRMGAGLARS